ncbi:MAG: type II toxin-antitoxin system RelE/ParE family toxin [Polyangiaceae bacterium]|nr:type II toxin-antitoxin system RelE/ParE family toxin [Polyangiaceae bacterium]
MKAYTIRWEPRALRELEEAQEHTGAGHVVVLDEELDGAEKTLSENPEIGPRARTRSRRHPTLRWLVLLRNPYLLYYRVSHKQKLVAIVALWHNRRRRPKL